MFGLGCDIGGTFTDFLLYDTRQQPHRPVPHVDQSHAPHVTRSIGLSRRRLPPAAQ
jgi:N-methylhydantoinase A/oxoprolinase/acetone carboxylase beta subunit